MLPSPVRTGFALAVAALASVALAGAEEGLTKRDSRGPVTVVVTLTEAPAVGAPLRVKVSLDTHSVGLDTIAFDRVVALRTSAGDLSPTAVEASQGGGHHRSALLVFPPPAEAGPVSIVVKDVGGVAERAFVWEAAAR